MFYDFILYNIFLYYSKEKKEKSKIKLKYKSFET